MINTALLQTCASVTAVREAAQIFMVTGHNKIGHVTLIVYFFNVLVTRLGPVLVSVVAMSARKKTDTVFTVILGNGESRFAFVISNTAICKKIPASNFGAGDFFIESRLILFCLC